MRIAYDLRRIGNPGIGRYMKSLVEAVTRMAPEHKYFLIVAPGAEAPLPDAPEAVRVLANSQYYSIREQKELPRVMEEHSIDLLHAPHFVVPLRKKCPTVVTIHDTIHLVYPQDLKSFTGRVYARLMMLAAVRVADEIITVSTHAKSEIVRFLGARESKIRVIYPGVNEEFTANREPSMIDSVRREYAINGDYILYTGIYKERKNHIGLLHAFAMLRQRRRDLLLVIAGPLKEGESILKKHAAELGLSDCVRLTGFVAEELLPSLYAGATVYACPSLYEGFGFTVLEAMGSGVPVVAHNGTSLPEVCGDAALLSDARQPEKFAAALAMALEPGVLRDSLIERGLDNVKRFTWEGCCSQVVQLYGELSKQTPQEVAG